MKVESVKFVGDIYIPEAGQPKAVSQLGTRSGVEMRIEGPYLVLHKTASLDGKAWRPVYVPLTNVASFIPAADEVTPTKPAQGGQQQGGKGGK